MNTTDTLVVRGEQRDSTVEERDLDGVVGENQLQIIVLNRFAGALVPISSTKVEWILFVDRLAHFGGNLGPMPDPHWQFLGINALEEYSLPILNLVQILNHCMLSFVDFRKMTRSSSNPYRSMSSLEVAATMLSG